MMSQVWLKIAPLACVLLLAACGGGGGSDTTVNNTGPSVEITSTNQQAVATEVSSNALQFTGSILSDSALMIDIDSHEADSINIRKLVTALQQQLHLQAVPVQPQAQAATIDNSENCTVSGKVTSSFDDTNDNKDWDAGETAMATFTDCVMSAGGVKISGSMQDELLSDTPFLSVDKVTFAKLKFSKGSVATELVSGIMTLTASVAGSIGAGSFQSSDRYQTQELKVAVSAGALSETFTVNEDVSLAQSSPNLSIQTITGSGSIQTNNANINGKVTFNITTPIIASIAQPITVTEGQMTISGSGGTSLYISFATPSTGTATLQVKKDGQNVGSPKEVPVATLLAGLTTT